MKIFPLKFYSIASQLSGVGEQYSDLIRPHLEYACAVWAPFAACDIALLESVQNRAALWINSIWIRLLSNGLSPLQSVLRI